jgi:Flp pilus assembly protein TadG
MSRSTFIDRLWHSQRGNVLVAAAASLPVMVGGAGLATDTMQWALMKRQVQRQADSAALSGAFALAQGKSAQTSATGDLARTSEIPLTGAPLIESPPSSGPGVSNVSAVRVALQTSRPLAFSGLFLSTPPMITAEATAAIVDDGTYCVVALESTTSVGITMSGSSTVDMGCGMATNSKASNAVEAGGSSQINATPVTAVGGLQWSNNYSNGTKLKPYNIPQKDPFASLPNPDISSMTCSNLNVGVHANESRSPGCYKNVDIKGTLRLNPGVYYIDGGEFSVGSQGQLTGEGVTIILTSSNAASNPNSIATVGMNAGAEVRLTAPTSGTYKGVIFYQDRRAVDSGDNKINGNSNALYQGAFYFPKQEIKFNGSAGMTTDCLQLVGRRVTFLGNSSVSNNCPISSGASAFRGSAVRLIG